MNTIGNTLEFVMPIMSSIRKLVFAAALFFGLSSVAIAQKDLPQAIVTSNRNLLIFQGHNLYLTSPGKPEAFHVINVSEDLHRAMSTASTVFFPESRSLNFAGKEYVLIIISHPSSSQPQGFCGAGEEDVLYVAELGQRMVETRYKSLINSCLKNIELESDGTASPFKSIAWTSSPAGFRVAWLSDAQGAESVQTYKIDAGKFMLLGR